MLRKTSVTSAYLLGSADIATLIASSHDIIWATECSETAEELTTGPYLGDSFQIVVNTPPECDANGPYDEACQGPGTTIELDGSASTDADGDTLTYAWTTNCPGATIDDPTAESPNLIFNSINSCPIHCAVGLTVNDGIQSAQCASDVSLTDEVAPTAVCDATGGEVDGNCEYTVPFSTTIDDNCCVNRDDVTVVVDLPTANATLGTPSITKTQVDDTQVQVSGTVLVSDLTSCPATVRVTVNATDCCGNPLETCVASADVVDVTPAGHHLPVTHHARAW